MSRVGEKLKLRAGELVEVRPMAEILETLDDDGCYENLPFMPEMQAFCGKQLRVAKRAHKSCDTINNTGGRRMRNAVHLQESRCDGEFHGGCEAECLFFWKEIWLRRITGEGAETRSGTDSYVELPDRWSKTTTDPDGATDEPITVFRCQATELPKATSLLNYWDVRQYVEDVTSGNVGMRQFLHGAAFALYRRLVNIGIGYRLLVRLFNFVARLRNKPPFPFVNGNQTKTPTRVLDLQIGEEVRVRSFEEIMETLDGKNMNRGLGFDNTEMRPHCGTTRRVRKRVTRIIDERTGHMLEMKNPCIVLDGVYCTGTTPQLRVFCPRAIPAYWREIWLERINEPSISDGNWKTE